jgi:hypothetical protein
LTTFLAVIGAVATVSCTSSGLLLWWLIRRHNRIRAAQVENLLAHMARHPAGRNIPDGEPFHARTVCGHKIYGDSLGDLLVNEVYHSRVCPHVVGERT